jgi:hypothetical protein
MSFFDRGSESLSSTMIAALVFGFTTGLSAPPSIFEVHNRRIHATLQLYSQNRNMNTESSDKLAGVHSSSNAEAGLLQLAQSHFVAQTLLAFVRLGLPDVMEVSRDMAIDQIISQLKPTPIRREVLFRCLRLLCTAGVVQERTKTIANTVQSTFSLTDMGALLQTSNTHSMTPFIQHRMEEPLWRAWSQLPGYLAGNGEDDKPPFDVANVMSASEYYMNNADSRLHRNAVSKMLLREKSHRF